MKHYSLIGATLLCAACASAPSSSDKAGLLTFVARDSGLVGTFDPAALDAPRAKTLIGRFGCASERLSSFNTTPAEDGPTVFNAACEGSLKYPEAAAGITWHEPTQDGHVTATVNGALVRIELP